MMRKLNSTKFFCLLLTFMNLKGNIDTQALEAHHTVLQLLETKDDAVISNQKNSEAFQIIASDLKAAIERPMKNDSQDLTNKIPCLDKSAKYRARPEKVGTVFIVIFIF